MTVRPSSATTPSLRLGWRPKRQPLARSKASQALDPVPAILLARLAVDRKHQGAGLGRSLLQDVLRCVDAADAIGARVLLVHAKHEAAKSWYMEYSFEESPTDPLHLTMLMKDVRASLERQGIG